MKVDVTTFRMPDDQYFRQATKKNLIVLHSTAGGTVLGAVRHWVSSESKIGTAYIIDRDGSIYQCFDPRYWAFHIGGKAGTDNEKRSIGIELVNWGPLRKGEDGSFYAWPNNWTKRVTKKESDVLAYRWRGQEYWHRFTNEQYSAVAQLTLHLCDEFDIDYLNEPPEADALKCKREFRDFRGILYHHNLRQDKFDAGPAWPGLDIASSNHPPETFVREGESG